MCKNMQGEMKYQWGFTIDYKYAILEVQSLVPIKLKFSTKKQFKKLGIKKRL